MANFPSIKMQVILLRNLSSEVNGQQLSKDLETTIAHNRRRRSVKTGHVWRCQKSNNALLLASQITGTSRNKQSSGCEFYSGYVDCSGTFGVCPKDEP